MSDVTYYAFFDVDETIINIKSMFSFLRYFCRAQAGWFSFVGDIKYWWFKTKIMFHKLSGKNREFLNHYYYQFYKNYSSALLARLSQSWFEQIISKENILNAHVVNAIRLHQQHGAEIVLVSGSFMECVAPLAQYLNIKAILAIQLEQINGVLTGNIISPQTIGKGKAVAIEHFLSDKNFYDLYQCYAYGDHISDKYMLELVGNPIVVGNDQILIDYAKSNGWKLIDKQ